jgi:WD40 repeat protein
VVAGAPHARTIFGLDFDLNLHRLASAGGDDALCVYDVGANLVPVLLARQEHAHEQDVNCVRWNPARTGVLVSGGDDGAVRVWRLGGM